MIKHMFLDMDGTLLNNEGNISEKDSEAIEKNNIPVTLVSSRSPQAMMATIKTLQLTTPQIAFNGGLIFQPSGDYNLVLEEHPLELVETELLMIALQRQFPALSVSYYDLFNWYTTKIDEGIVLEAKVTHQLPKMIAQKTLFEHEPNKLFKVAVMTLDEQLMSAVESFVQHLNLQTISVQRSGQYHLEMTSLQAQKARGIDYIMHRNGLTAEELVAFGEGYNDLSMFAKVAHPIVMKNALAEIKQYAKFITKANTQDGISYGIKKYVRKLG